MKFLKAIERYEGQHRFLSNFYPCSIEMKLGGETYVTRSVEHAYQMSKFEVCSPPFLEIFYASSAGTAKKIADANKNLVVEGFHDTKYQLMAELLEKKFYYGSELADLLAMTGTAHLVEGNTWGDTFWGICDGVGSNNLGKLHMQLREAILQRLKYDFLKVNQGWKPGPQAENSILGKLHNADMLDTICELLGKRNGDTPLLEALKVGKL